MILHILFGQRRESYPEEHAPEALLVWDEYAVEENGDEFEKQIEKTKEEHGGLKSFAAFRVIDVQVHGDKIRSLLVGKPVVQGEIKTTDAAAAIKAGETYPPTFPDPAG